MSDTDSHIWIVEDSVHEVIEAYLDPLERIAGELNGPFPRVHVIVIGISDWDQVEIDKIHSERQQRYAHTQPFVEWTKQHEQDPEAFLEELRRRVRANDVVLVDGTVCGRSWPTREDGYLRYVFNALRSDRPASKRVVLVTNVTKMDHEGFRHLTDVTLPKNLSGKKDDYVSELKRKISPSQDWIDGLNDEGKKTLLPYVEWLAKAPKGRAERENIDSWARNLLVSVLDPQLEPPRSLSEGVKQRRTYYDPRDSQSSFEVPSSGNNLAVRRVLVQRRVIYGLRQLWLQSAPERNDDEAYLLWLEVVAAGFHWYSGEQETVKTLPLWAKRNVLDGTLNEITLADEQQFRGKHGLVTKALVEPIDRGIRREGQSSRIRFIEAKVSFRHQGETTSGKPRYHYKLTTPGIRGQVPKDRASVSDWDEFWKTRQVPPASIPAERKGHIDAIHSALSHGNHFSSHEMMLRMPLPMDEETAWWQSVGPELSERFGSPQTFNAWRQSDRRKADGGENDSDTDSAGTT